MVAGPGLSSPTDCSHAAPLALLPRMGRAAGGPLVCSELRVLWGDRDVWEIQKHPEISTAFTAPCHRGAGGEN